MEKPGDLRAALAGGILIFGVLQKQIPHPSACGRQGRQPNGASLPTAGRFRMSIIVRFFAACKAEAAQAVRAEAARGMRTKDNRPWGQAGLREKAQ